MFIHFIEFQPFSIHFQIKNLSLKWRIWTLEVVLRVLTSRCQAISRPVSGRCQAVFRDLRVSSGHHQAVVMRSSVVKLDKQQCQDCLVRCNRQAVVRLSSGTSLKSVLKLYASGHCIGKALRCLVYLDSKQIFWFKHLSGILENLLYYIPGSACNSTKI